MSAPETPEAEPEQEPVPRQDDTTAEPNVAAAKPQGAVAGALPAPSTKRSLRRPTLAEASALVVLVGGVAGLVFKFAPGCEPQPPSAAVKATISDVRAVRPVSFRRFLQRQQIPISPDMSPQFLARRGVMVQFHYDIIGLSGKQLLLSWELSDATTNERVAAEQSAYKLAPSKNEDAGDWAIWVPAPKAGRNYYATVTIYKPEGPPYELKHFDTARFPGFASSA